MIQDRGRSQQTIPAVLGDEIPKLTPRPGDPGSREIRRQVSLEVVPRVAMPLEEIVRPSQRVLPLPPPAVCDLRQILDVPAPPCLFGREVLQQQEVVTEPQEFRREIRDMRRHPEHQKEIGEGRAIPAQPGQRVMRHSLNQLTIATEKLRPIPEHPHFANPRSMPGNPPQCVPDLKIIKPAVPEEKQGVHIRQQFASRYQLSHEPLRRHTSDLSLHDRAALRLVFHAKSIDNCAVRCRVNIGQLISWFVGNFDQEPQMG